MANADIAERISQALRAGIEHPGSGPRPKPQTLLFPVFRVQAKAPEQMNKLVETTTTMLGEAVVHEIEKTHELVPKEELRALRYQVAETEHDVLGTPVYCRCDTERRDPLTVLTIRDSALIVVDGPNLLRGLHERSIECPHGRIK